MDSSEQNNISEWLKRLGILAIIALINFMFIMSGNNKNIKVLSFNNKDSKSVFNEQVTGINIKSDSDDRLELVGVYKNLMTNTFTIDINGFVISLIDNTNLYIKPIEERYNLLQDICNNYINQVGLDVRSITQIEVNGRVESVVDERVSILKESSEVANEVYNAEVISESISDLQVRVKVAEPIIIEPKVIVNTTDELYLGNSTVEEGVQGKSIVYKELVYDGLKKNEEVVVGEKVIKPVINTVVNKGSKNPYYDGIAFLVRPTSGGYISSKYGEIRGNKAHKGIDIAEDLGKDVSASLDGKVIRAGYNSAGYGNLVIIEHDNNMKTYYAHLNKIYVAPGDIVKKGNVIGVVGSTGNSTGPHLHFELRVNEIPVDPINYIIK